MPLGIAGGAVGAQGARRADEPRDRRADLARRARAWDARRAAAIAFYGLNPLVLVFAVAGAHNETLFGMFVAAGALCVARRPRARGGARARRRERGQGLGGAGAAVRAARRAGAAGAAASRCAAGARGAPSSAGRVRAARPRHRPARWLTAAAPDRRPQHPLAGLEAARPRRARARRARRLPRAVRAACSPRRCGAPGAARRGSTATAGRRSRCSPRPPGCCRGTACGRCCRRR